MIRSLSVVALVLASAAGSFAQAPGAASAQPTTPSADTPRKSKPKLYDEQADAKQQIADALKSAKKNNRRVLIQWGGNWCGWCIKLHELFTGNEEIASLLRAEYDVVHIDAGNPPDKNMDLAKSYGAEPATKGFPYITILDADGKVVANHDTGSLELQPEQGKEVVMAHDPKLVMGLLKKHQAPAQDAAKLLDAALAKARQEKKTVFLHFGAPWCGWCRRLEAWMDRADVSPLLTKAFIDLKIDTERNTGGNDLLIKYAGSDKVGIPWFAFVSPDGTVIADTFAEQNGKKSNVGFPAAPEEIAHFERMLKKVGSISDEDVKSIIEKIRADKPKQKAAH